MLRSLYDWTLSVAAHRNARWGLATVSFVESSVFPIPPDVVLIPMVLADRRRAWTLATICTVASVLGGVAGYAIGYFLFDAFGRPLLDFYGYAENFAHFQERYNEHGAWWVFGAGLTPFPYKVITITSGVMDLNFMVFMIASVLSRGARFFLLAALLWHFGPPIRGFIERYLPQLTFVFFALLFGGFIALRYLF